MLSEKETTRISRFLSLVLRHQPEVIGVELDPNGWTNVQDLIERANLHGTRIDRETLNHIVETNPKKRFAFNEDGEMIRASQGHSIDVDLGYQNEQPPEFLYHGTGETSVASILKSGIEKRSRQHVHLSKDLETALMVGKRHGKPVVFKVHSEQMHFDQYPFFLSENGVWLTDHVPAKYLLKMDDE